MRIEQLETRSLLSGPDAVNDSYSALHGQTITETASTGVLANDVDYNNLTMSAVLETNPAQGMVTLNSDGSFTDVPATNFVGSDSFTYEATDADGASSPATVTLTYTNIAPVANNDAYNVTLDTLNTAAQSQPGVLANDYDYDGDTLSAVLVAAPSHGTLQDLGGRQDFGSGGSFIYTPAPNFTGTDTFTYAASDGVSLSAPATVTLTVSKSFGPQTNPNDTPLGNVTTNAYDPAGRLTTVTLPSPSGTGPSQLVTTNYYDNLGNLIETSNGLSEITTNFYNSLNQLTSTTDPEGRRRTSPTTAWATRRA